MQTTKATAHLPGLDMEIIHERASDGQSERIAIHLQSVPSFEAFSRVLEPINPFAFWAEALRLAWLPWLDVHSAMLPWYGIPAAGPMRSGTKAPRRLSSRGGVTTDGAETDGD